MAESILDELRRWVPGMMRLAYVFEPSLFPVYSNPIGPTAPRGRRRSPSRYLYVMDEGRLRLVHRVRMEKHLGRPLLDTEVVHHIDENPRNNAIENLQIMTRVAHGLHHATVRACSALYTAV